MRGSDAKRGLDDVVITLVLVRSCSILVQLQFRFSNSVKNFGLFLEYWIALYDTYKVFKNLSIYNAHSVSLTVSTKASLKSFSIGKLPLNMYINPI